MNRISAMLKFVVGALLCALVGVVCVTVVFRYVLNSSLYWATEVPNFILVWMVFLGSVVAFHEKKHIAFDLVAVVAPPPLRRVLAASASLVVLIFVGGLLYFGIILVVKTMNSPSEALKIPQGLLYLCLPLSMGLIGVSAFQQLIASLRSPPAEIRR